jgi:predicted DNA repair protein MutK
MTEPTNRPMVASLIMPPLPPIQSQTSMPTGHRGLHAASGDMPGTSLIALLDDIASVLDDVAALTKVAAQKTAGVLGDDIALNAQQVAGVQADRELPVVFAVATGSAINKAILVPLALAISALAPWLVSPLLMVGGAYLCFEGSEKLLHKWLPAAGEDAQPRHPPPAAASLDPRTFEKDKIKGAVRTDFVLSAEIIAITLGTVAEAAFMTRVAVLVGIAVVMTVGVYGLVAGIVKLDDAGLHMSRAIGTHFASRAQRRLGNGLLLASPYLMKTLSVVGTAAMFLVGGGILVHGLPPIHHAIEALKLSLGAAPAVGGALAELGSPIASGLLGVLAGGLLVGLVSVFGMARRAFQRRGGR